MSVKRKNWSALSSLARQRTLEDEEEQERERRRRLRSLSSTTDDEAPKVTHNGDQPAAERLPSLEEAKAPKSHSSIKEEEDENFQEVLRTRQERRLRRQALEASQSPIKEQLEVEKKKESQSAGSATPEPSVLQKDVVPLPRRKLSQKQKGPWARDEMNSEGGETKDVKTLEQKSVSAPERTQAQDQTAPERKRASEKTPGQDQVAPERKRDSEKSPGQDQTDPERKKDSEKSPGQDQAAPDRKSTSEKTPAQDQAASERKRASEKTPVQDQAAPERKSTSEKTPVQDQAAPERKSTSEKTPVQDQAAPERKSTSEKTPVQDHAAPEKNVTSEKTSASVKASLPEKTLVPKETLAPKKVLAGEKALTSMKTSGPGKDISEESLIPKKLSTRERALAFERTLAQEKTLIPEKGSVREKIMASRKLGLEQPPVQAQEQKDSERDVPENKEQNRREASEKSPCSEGSGRERKSETQAIASRFKPFTLKVKIASKEAETELTSPSQVTYSSSLTRSSPRTISFRMNRRENSETTLTRSASVRLPSNTVKLGEKLERYHTAIQRSESVKAPGSSRTEFLVAPVGVARKRTLFEKEQVRNSRAEPALSRKEGLRLSGVVTSRLNLWVSRTQDAGGDQDSQDIKKGAASTKRTSWGKQVTSPTDTQL